MGKGLDLLEDVNWNFFSRCWTALTLSAFLYARGVPALGSFSWPSSGCAPTAQCFTYAGGPRAQCRTPGEVPQRQSRGGESSPSTLELCLDMTFVGAVVYCVTGYKWHLHPCRITPVYWRTSGFVLDVTIWSYIDPSKLCRVVKVME